MLPCCVQSGHTRIHPIHVGNTTPCGGSNTLNLDVLQLKWIPYVFFATARGTSIKSQCLKSKTLFLPPRASSSKTQLLWLIFYVEEVNSERLLVGRKAGVKLKLQQILMLSTKNHAIKYSNTDLTTKLIQSVHNRKRRTH